MRNFRLVKKLSLIAAGVLATASLMAIGVATVAQDPISAASCTPSMSTDKDTDIIWGGLTGTNTSTLRANLKTRFDSNDGGNCHQDLKAIYGSTLGLSDTMLNDTANWALGQTTHDGKITTDAGKVVGTSTQVFSRCWNISSTKTNCEPGSAYKLILNQTSGSYRGVYSHAATFYMNSGNTPERTLIHINPTTGVADFAIWIHCGNALQFTPVVPVKSLQCVSLTTPDSDTTMFTFTAKATQQNQSTAQLYVSFGDGQKSSTTTLGQSTTIFQVVHTYTQTDIEQHFVAQIFLGLPGNLTAQGGNCQLTVTVPPKEKLTFACAESNGLEADLIHSTNNSRTYRFTGNVTGTDTPATYRFFFDSEHQTASQTSNQAEFTYTFDTSKSNSFKAYFVSTSTTGLTTDKNSKSCQFTFSTTLIRTGPEGGIGIAAIASTLGFGIHQLILRRKLSA